MKINFLYLYDNDIAKRVFFDLPELNKQDKMKNGGMRWVSNSTAGISFRQFFNSENSGSSNTVGAGHTYAGIFGCNVTAVMSCAFHANNFVAKNLTLLTGAIPGLLQYCLAPAILGFPAGTKLLVTT